MLKPLEIANFFIKIANSENEGSITNMKLNKLLYFAQAWSLTKYGEPLFEEEIQAWQHGPVVPSIDKAFRICGYNPINDTAGDFSSKNFSQRDIQLLIDVYNEFGKYSATKLADMTHEKGGPWATVYKNYISDIVIPLELIRDYYEQEPCISTFHLPKLSADNFTGFRNENNVLVLPKEDNNAEDDDYE